MSNLFEKLSHEGQEDVILLCKKLGLVGNDPAKALEAFLNELEVKSQKIDLLNPKEKEQLEEDTSKLINTLVECYGEDVLNDFMGPEEDEDYDDEDDEDFDDEDEFDDEEYEDDEEYDDEEYDEDEDEDLTLTK